MNLIYFQRNRARHVHSLFKAGLCWNEPWLCHMKRDSGPDRLSLNIVALNVVLKGHLLDMNRVTWVFPIGETLIGLRTHAVEE